jgi:hypothetical protein
MTRALRWELLIAGQLEPKKSTQAGTALFLAQDNGAQALWFAAPAMKTGSAKMPQARRAYTGMVTSVSVAGSFRDKL